jgi:hypothetical protein
LGPLVLIFLVAAVFMVLERAFPGRALPASRGWYQRAVLLNGVHLGIVLLGGVHHQLDVHHYNYGDITWWDRLFGTYRDPDAFTASCGFHGDREQRFGAMLVFRDVNRAS